MNPQCIMPDCSGTAFDKYLWCQGCFVEANPTAGIQCMIPDCDLSPMEDNMVSCYIHSVRDEFFDYSRQCIRTKCDHYLKVWQPEEHRICSDCVQENSNSKKHEEYMAESKNVIYTRHDNKLEVHVKETKTTHGPVGANLFNLG